MVYKKVEILKTLYEQSEAFLWTDCLFLKNIKQPASVSVRWPVLQEMNASVPLFLQFFRLYGFQFPAILTVDFCPLLFIRVLYFLSFVLGTLIFALE